VKVRFRLESFEKDGEMFTKIAKIKLHFTTTKLFLNLQNLFNGENRF
jgi:hypothetical protein